MKKWWSDQRRCPALSEEPTSDSIWRSRCRHKRHSLDRSGGLAKLFFRLFTNLAKTLIVQCAANSACATFSRSAPPRQKTPVLPPSRIGALGAWITARGRRRPCGAVLRKWVRAVGGMMSRVQRDDGARKAKAASHLGLAAGANLIRELVV